MTLRRRIVTGLCLLMIGSLAHAQESKDDSTPKIICLGDSITTGYRASGKQRWIALLQNEVEADGIKVVNWGAPGRTTGRALEVMQDCFAELTHVRMLIVFVGGNNVSFCPEEQGEQRVKDCAKDIAAIVGCARTAYPDIPIVICAPPEKNYKRLSAEHKARNALGPHSETIFRNLAKAYERVAEEKGVGFVSLIDTVDEDRYPDGIHPDVQGHAQMWPHIWKEVKPRLEE